MKKTILITLLLAIQFSGIAQKTTVAIKTLRTVANARYNNNEISAGQAKVEDFVTDKFVNTKRFDIVDRASLGELQSEKQLQRTEDFIDGKVIEQSKTLGADYLVGIYISTLDILKNDSYFGCKMAFTIRVMDISTSQVVATETFTGSAGTGLISFIATADAAVEKALAGVSAKMDDFISSNFAIKASIANIEESDATGAATKVLISAGSSNGVAVGQFLKVMETIEMQVDGKTLQRKKEIGQLEITSIEDENFSVCTVLKGGVDIAKKKAEGKKLQAIIQKN